MAVKCGQREPHTTEYKSDHRRRSILSTPTPSQTTQQTSTSALLNIMRTSIAFASILSFASVALGQGCAEASRFGNSVVTASSSKALVAGDVRRTPSALVWSIPADTHTQTLKVTTNYTCALQFGIKPTFTDYTINVEQNNNGHEPEIFLLRVDNPPTISTVTLKVS
jgi:hypothetical protein